MAAPIRKFVVKMTQNELYQHVRSIAKDTARIYVTNHAKLDRMQERGITFKDIVNVLQTGKMFRQAEPGKHQDEVNCRFEGNDIDGDRIGVEVAVSDSRPNLLVITVIRY